MASAAWGGHTERLSILSVEDMVQPGEPFCVASISDDPPLGTSFRVRAGVTSGGSGRVIVTGVVGDPAQQSAQICHQGIAHHEPLIMAATSLPHPRVTMTSPELDYNVNVPDNSFVKEGESVRATRMLSIQDLNWYLACLSSNDVIAMTMI